MTEARTHHHKASSRGPVVNWTAGVALVVWGLLFFAGVFNLAFLDQVGIEDGWIRRLGVALTVITLLIRWALLRHSGEHVELDDLSIRHVKGSGRSTGLLWTEVLDLRRNALTGSFELVGPMDGAVVPVHRGLEAYGILMTDVIGQLDRHRMRRSVSEAGFNSVPQPASYTRDWSWQAGFCSLCVIVMMSTIGTDPSVFIVAILGIAAVVESAFKHPHRVVVDSAAVRLFFPLRIRQVALNEIVECSLILYREAGRWVLAPAVIPFEAGDTVVLKGFGNQAFALYDKIQLARRVGEVSLLDDPTPNLWQPRVRRRTVIAATVLSLVLINHVPFTSAMVMVSAARRGSEPIVRLSLLLGTDVDVRDTSGRTSLYEAAKYGHLEIAEFLVERGADVHAPRDHPGYTPVHVAAEYGHVEVVRLLLEAGAHADVKNVWYQTPLSQLAWMAQENADEIAALLLERGADVNSRDNRGFTPLHRAVREGKVAFARYLAANGADVSASTDQGTTVLRYAMRYEQLEAARVVIEAGADIDATYGENGRSELGYAVRSRDTTVVEFLLEHGARSDVSGNDGWTPVHLAANDGHVDFVRRMLDAGADIELPGVNGTILMEAVHGEHLELVEFLLRRGALPDTPDEEGWPPLHLATYHGTVQLVRAMLEGGADPNLSSDGVPPPLWNAANRGHAEVLRLLWESDADVNVQYRGRTPLAMALRNGHSEIATFLRDHGASQ